MNGQITGSTLAAPAVIPPDYVPPQEPPLTEEQERTIMGMPMNRETALMGAEAATMMMGPVGMAASGGISFLSADEHAKNEMKRMVDQYRDQLAEVTGKPAELVTVEDLDYAAHHDERFATLMRSVMSEKESRPVGSIAALPGFMAGASAGSFAGPVGSIVGGTLGAMGADSAVSKMMGNNPEESVDFAIQSICDRLANGETVSTADVFNVRIQQDERLAEIIRNDHVDGKSFHEMDVQAQMQVLKDPEYQALANQCYYDSLAINNGGDPMSLVMGRVAPPQGNFTQAVMAGRGAGEAAPKNFREAVTSRMGDADLAV